MVDLYSQMLPPLMGIPPAQARSMLKDWIKAAKEESRREAMDKLPPRLGDVILMDERPEVRARVADLRAEGVKDEDIRWWWNMHDIERRLIKRVDNVFRYGTYTVKTAAEGQTQRSPADALRKAFPTYGDPSDTTHTSGDDRPLPWELKERVNTWIQREMARDPDALKKRVEESSTMNALIRAAIRDGEL